MSEESPPRDPATAASEAATSATHAATTLAKGGSPTTAVSAALQTAAAAALVAAGQNTEARAAQRALEQASGATERAAALAQNANASTITAAAGQAASTVASAAGASDTTREVLSAAQQAAQYGNSVVGAVRSARSGGASSGGSGSSSGAHESSGSSARGGHDSSTEHNRAHGSQLPPETYALDVQDNAAPGWTFVSFRGREGLSEVYEFTIELEHEHELQDPQDLLGKNIALRIERDHHERRFVGVVRQTEDTGSQGQHQRARITVVPGLWTLGLRKTSRIFQGKTVPEIVGAVLREGFRATQRDFDLRLRGTYLPREYCVQYNETDLAFVQRLLAEEGIGFFFDHVGTKERIVLFDDNGLLTPVLDGDADQIAIANSNPQMHPTHTVQSFPWTRAMGSTKSVVRDWDWTQQPPVRKESTAAASDNADAYPVYSGQSEVTLASYQDKRYGKETTTRQAQLRRQSQALGTQRSEARSNVTLFAPGRTFRLVDHAHHTLEQRYTLVSLEHRGSNHRISSSGSTDASQGYSNTFHAVPHATPWRPVRVPRPRLVGVQTAKVVGPEDEEIYTDEHGRIKVRFHWDRVEDDDAHASCWMRVAQSWAGSDWGFVFIPRVGMEVLVQFVDGNPDRPLITGTVYNGQNTLPYPHPEKKTQSVIKTRSSPGGGGYNELRFEDLKGEEEVYLRAQKDLNEMVRNNHTTKIGNDQANLVRRNHSESVGGNQTLGVTKDRQKTVTGNEVTIVQENRTETVIKDESVTVHGKRMERIGHEEDIGITGGRKVVVSGDFEGFTEQTLVTGTRKAVVSGKDELWVQAPREEHVDATLTVTAGKYELHQGGTAMIFESSHVLLEADDWVEIKHGGGSVKIETDGRVAVRAESELKLVCGSASITLKANGEILINGPTKVDLSASGAGITAEPAKTTVHGPEVAVAASGMNQITGAPVKLN